MVEMITLTTLNRFNHTIRECITIFVDKIVCVQESEDEVRGCNSVIWLMSGDRAYAIEDRLTILEMMAETQPKT